MSCFCFVPRRSPGLQQTEDTPTMRPPSLTRAVGSKARRAPGGLRGLLAVAAAALLAGCSTSLGPEAGATASIKSEEKPAAATQRQRQVKIAMLLPLAGFGPTAVVGKAMKQAGEMALFEHDNPAVQLVVKDDRGTAEGARAATEEAIKEGAEIVLGPLLSDAVPGAAAAARAAGVPVLAFSNNRQHAGQGVYLMSFLAEPEVVRVVSYAVQRGKRRFAGLLPDDAYGRAVEPAFREAVERAGGSLAAVEFYPVHANGMLEPARRLVAAIKADEQAADPVDALFVPGGPDQLHQLGPLLAYSGVDPTRIQLLGTGSWDFPNIGRDQAFVGGWYPGPDPRGFSEFSQRFAKTFGAAPPRIASLAHDAVTMAIALSTNPPGQRYTPGNLTRPAGFVGVDGSVRFTPAGLAERGLAILEVQPFGSKVLEPAPGSGSSSQLSDAAPASGLPAAGQQGAPPRLN